MPHDEEWERAGCEACEERQRELERLEQENERLKRRPRDLTAQLEQAQQAGKRQAAPFSKGAPRADGKRPGRHAGSGYGPKAWRAIPAQVDRTIEVPLPPCCPQCGGPLEEQRLAEQYQEELPEVRPQVARFQVQVGRCQQCGRRVQGRHPEQTSDALGAAQAQLGPRAVALAAQLNNVVGASLGKTAMILEQLGGLHVTRGGVSQALARAGRLAGPT